MLTTALDHFIYVIYFMKLYTFITEWFYLFKLMWLWVFSFIVMLRIGFGSKWLSIVLAIIEI